MDKREQNDVKHVGYIIILNHYNYITIIIKVQLLNLKPNSTNNFKLAWFVMLNIKSLV